MAVRSICLVDRELSDQPLDQQDLGQSGDFLRQARAHPLKRIQIVHGLEGRATLQIQSARTMDNRLDVLLPNKQVPPSAPTDLMDPFEFVVTQVAAFAFLSLAAGQRSGARL